MGIISVSALYCYYYWDPFILLTLCKCSVCLYACFVFLFTSFRLFPISPFYSYFRFFLGESSSQFTASGYYDLTEYVKSEQRLRHKLYDTVKHMKFHFSLNLRTHVWTSKRQAKHLDCHRRPILFALLPTGNDWASHFPPTQMKVGGEWKTMRK